jgi:hypothetical protein
MRKLLVELSYYEDLYSFVVSGYITLKDSQGFLESLHLTGNEFIEINFSKIKDGINSNDQLFRLYKVGNRAQTGNMNTEYYTFYFCSEELLLSEQTKIGKSYSGQNISDTIRSIVTDKLNINNKPLIIEDTVGLYNFVIPGCSNKTGLEIASKPIICFILSISNKSVFIFINIQV